jgi:hypothetical protein
LSTGLGPVVADSVTYHAERVSGDGATQAVQFDYAGELL